MLLNDGLKVILVHTNLSPLDELVQILHPLAATCIKVYRIPNPVETLDLAGIHSYIKHDNPKSCNEGIE